MLEYKKVLDGFIQLAGIEEERAAEQSLIIDLSIFEVQSMCGDKCELPENAERLCSAAAALAYYKYCLLASSHENSFKAGDLTVSGADSAEIIRSARALRDDAIAMIYDIVGDGSFYFGQV